MEGIGRRNFKKISLSVKVNLLRMQDCSFK